MSLFDFLGGGKTVQPQMIDPRTDQRKQIDTFLSNYISNYGGQYQPGKQYGRPLTAPMSSFERSGLDNFLSTYLNQPNVSPQLQGARSMLSDTINGGFDPGTSQYYQALRDTSQYNRDTAIRDTNADLGARGKYFSTEALNKYGDINAQTQIGLNGAMAQLADKERARQFAAVPLTQNLEDYISRIPLTKATAATTIGALPRTIEQGDLESQYQDFLRQQKEGAGVISAGTGVSNANITSGYPDQPLKMGGANVTDFLSQFLGSDMGQGALTSIGSGIGSLFGSGGLGAAVSGAGASLAQFLPMLLAL